MKSYVWLCLLLAGCASQQPELKTEMQVEMKAKIDPLAVRMAQVEEGVRTNAAVLQAQGGASLAERLARIEKHLANTDKQLSALGRMLEQARIRDNGKVLFSVTLTADKALYPLNNPDLEAADIAQINTLAKRLKTIEGEYHLDIQGHTDALRGDDFDYALGRARAEVVRRYLHSQLGVEPWRMSVTSYGASQPLVGGSPGNRRILIRVLVSEEGK